jgi:methylenetetrahydrofolate--tRNA-(uracil-5-)-methyltransferase
MMTELKVIGGGLAGSEAAWQIAKRGFRVRLFEMRPAASTGAHLTGDLAELVCSNSLGSNLADRASGLLKNELRRLNSLLVECAEKVALPAGSALAVDRVRFARLVTHRLSQEPNIEIVREEVREIPEGPTIIASGPLTSDPLANSIAALGGENHLFFFDAIAPIVRAQSIDMGIAFKASRYAKGGQAEGDYLNCPFNREQYENFVHHLRAAERIELRSFEESIRSGVKAGAFFEGCLPVEIIAERGRESLAFGPMRPVGIVDPRSKKRPYAVVQLRQDDLAASLYNLVGFQTNLTFAEQKRVFGMIPGLEHAEFERFGQMHRNTFIASPRLLRPTLQHTARADLFFAGQITGVEGYMGNIGTGLLAGINLARTVAGREPLALPRETMLGALCHYITHASLKDFQPMKSNFGILPDLGEERKPGKRERGLAYADRSLAALEACLEGLDE